MGSAGCFLEGIFNAQYSKLFNCIHFVFSRMVQCASQNGCDCSLAITFMVDISKGILGSALTCWNNSYYMTAEIESMSIYLVRMKRTLCSQKLGMSCR